LTALAWSKPAGNTIASPFTGLTAGDQFAGDDQFGFAAAPVHVRVAAVADGSNRTAVRRKVTGARRRIMREKILPA
jgi:hypothetical protein